MVAAIGLGVCRWNKVDASSISRDRLLSVGASFQRLRKRTDGTFESTDNANDSSHVSLR